MFLDHSMEGDDVRVGRCQPMKGYFANMKLALTGAAVDLGCNETLDGVETGDGVASVDCAVHDAVSSHTKYLYEFESVVVDKGADRRGRGSLRRGLFGRHPGVRRA